MNTPEIVKTDPWLAPFEGAINNRISHYHHTKTQLEQYFDTLDNLASAYKYFGVQNEDDEQVYREWAPNAEEVYLVGAFCNWEKNNDYKFTPLSNGVWELRLKERKLKHGDLFKLHIFWEGGDGMRLPAYARRVIQDEVTKGFDAQLWMPRDNFTWTDDKFKPSVTPLLIYEAHIGMSSEKEEVSSFIDFKNNILPRIVKAGYNCIQFMAIQEHPYYGSFGYHVSNFFAVSSRFGTPEELKELINEAHNNGITVIMDIVHSHAVKNELEGIAKLDGTSYQYFHDGGKGDHPAWDSKCFNYGKNEVMQFLLSNCKFWLEEFHFDGYRFDGVTSMLYTHHGLEYSFSSYGDYYNGTEDIDAMTYLTLANEIIHQVKPEAITVAEDMSGLPGLAAPIKDGGIGFDYRLSMGVPDFWIKLIKEHSDENWNVAQIFHELSQHRAGEKVVSYAESHDQALVGDKTILFRLVDKEMYDKMDLASQSLIIDRGIALHKMIRLATMTTSSGGYLNFMGNEFGHPEWIDFPREGNNWSFKHARRQWNLMDHKDLKFQWLSNFDKAMIDLANKAFSVPDEPCYSVMANEVDQVMCYKRGNYYMIFNFSPSNSYTDYGISVVPGKYNVVLSSDNKKFGGYGNIDEDYLHLAEKVPFQDNHYQIKLYIPSRTAMVLKHSAPKRVY
ncbi:alpha-amylase family glycosyl hydrolase [Saccharicrinis aurantiacus]|uniref:alpha-amylase family glycosyl hydrolase n=1 Tax=Saccharicrinis aurantiacus TaxID=1849719 RepID=UPI00094FE66F|nr:alpha-amylase family glycosyl hydrolase [Saccharicrinis aurantiacus]